MTLNCAHRKTSRGILIGYNKIPIDLRVLNSLAEMRIDTEKAQSCLEANRHNHLTTTYYLSLKKYIREGGESPCDLAAKSFDQSLLEPVGSNNRRD
jgi:5'-AMP-activated protein kinase catalytic alpha subunit